MSEHTEQELRDMLVERLDHHIEEANTFLTNFKNFDGIGEFLEVMEWGRGVKEVLIARYFKQVRTMVLGGKVPIETILENSINQLSYPLLRGHFTPNSTNHFGNAVRIKEGEAYAAMLDILVQFKMVNLGGGEPKLHIFERHPVMVDTPAPEVTKLHRSGKPVKKPRKARYTRR